MRRNQKRLSRAGLGLLGAGLLAASWYGAESLRVTQPEAPASAETKGAIGARRYAHPWAGVYSLALKARVAANGEGPLAEFRLTGELALREADANDPRLWQLAFEGDYETFAGQALAKDAAAALETELKQPWRIRFDPAGRVADVEVAAGLTPFTAQIWKSIAYSMQLVPATTPETPWRTEERDTVGLYLAEYKDVAGDGTQPDEASIHKTKLRYLETEGGMSELKVSYHIEQAEQLFRFDGDGHWVGLNHTENLWIDGMGGLPGFTSTSELRLAVTPDRDVSETVNLDAQPTAYESALASRDPRDLLGPARLQGLPWSEALARLHQFATTRERDDAQQKQAARAYLALTEHLRQDPTRVATAERAVLEGGPLTQTWIEALRDADTPESHTALASLAQSPTLQPRERMLAVRALSRVHTPSKETVSALQALDTDPRLGRQAVYGLGSNIYRLRENDPQLASDALAPLVAELEQTKDDAHQIKLLIALGNSGDPVALSIARTRLGHASERVRAAALQAVRRVEDGGADRLLAEGLHDRSPIVRRSALDALFDRPPREPAIHAVNTLLLGESEPGVRAQALNLALRWRERAPALLEGLRLVAEQEPIESLRNAAQRALASSSQVSGSTP
jgi:HEAT repeat protein